MSESCFTFALSLLLALSCGAFAEKDSSSSKVTRTFEGIDLQTFLLQTPSSDSRIRASYDGLAKVEVKKVKWDEKCELSIEKSNDQLLVRIEDSEPSFHRNTCVAELDIVLPKALAMDIKTGSGDIQVSKMEGDIEFKLGSGSVQIDSKAPTIKGVAGSGDIEIIGETKTTSLRTGSGNIQITVVNPIEAGLIDIRTGSGDAKLKLPKTMKLFTDFRAGSGEIENEFDNNREAKFKVSMRAGSGDLTIQKVAQEAQFGKD